MDRRSADPFPHSSKSKLREEARESTISGPNARARGGNTSLQQRDGLPSPAAVVTHHPPNPSFASMLGRNMTTGMPIHYSTTRPLPVEGVLARLPRDSFMLEHQMAADYVRRQQQQQQQQLNIESAIAMRHLQSHVLGYPESRIANLAERARAVVATHAMADHAAATSERSDETVQQQRSSPLSTASTAASHRRFPRKAPKRRAVRVASSSSSAPRASDAGEIVFDISEQDQRAGDIPRPGDRAFRPSALRQDWDRIECRTDAMDDTASDQSRLVKELFSRRLCALPSIPLPDRLDGTTHDAALGRRKRHKKGSK